MFQWLRKLVFGEEKEREEEERQQPAKRKRNVDEDGQASPTRKDDEKNAKAVAGEKAKAKKPRTSKAVDKKRPAKVAKGVASSSPKKARGKKSEGETTKSATAPQTANDAKKVVRKVSLHSDWTDHEHINFLDALQLYGNNWERYSSLLPNKDALQVRHYAEIFYQQQYAELVATANRQNQIFQQQQQVSPLSVYPNYAQYAYRPPYTGTQPQQQLLPTLEQQRAAQLAALNFFYAPMQMAAAAAAVQQQVTIPPRPAAVDEKEQTMTAKPSKMASPKSNRGRNHGN